MYWSPELNVGLPVIDGQHWYIFSVIQRIHQSDTIEGLADINAAIDKLVLLAQRHFDCEEWLIVKFEYPDAIKHILEHEDLIIEIREYQQNNVFRRQQLSLVLFNWLVSHVLMEDRPLAAYLKASLGMTQPRIPGSLERAFWDLAGDLLPPASLDRKKRGSVSGVMPASNAGSKETDSRRSDIVAPAAISNRRK
jgi:hemerythrin